MGMYQILIIFTLAVMAVCAPEKYGPDGCRIINAGTNYEYSECRKRHYLKIGESCQPRSSSRRKRSRVGIETGICKATLFCNPETLRCDCEDSGNYLFVAENGKCRNYVGSRCFDSSNCVQNAECVKKTCV